MTETDAQEWQRLAPLALVFLVLTGLQKFVRENLFWFAGAGAGFAFLDWLGPRELLLGGLAVLLMIVASAVIFHRRFRFRLEEDAVRVRRGLFEKKELRVRFARVQNVQLGQPFYFRPFDLVRFSLETPGASEKEVELPGIPRALAETMRDRIIGAQSGSSAVEDEAASADGPVTEQAEAPLFAASVGRLFVHGMGSNQVWILAGVAAWLIGSITDRIDFDFEDSIFLDWLANRLDSVWLTIGFFLALGLSVLILLSGVLSVVRFYRYRLHEREQRLVGIGGLLDEREQTVRRPKVTGLTLKQSALGRLFGSWYLMIRQARSADGDVPGQRKGFLVPGLRRQDHELVDRLIPGWQVPEQLTGIDRQFRQYFWLRSFLLFSLVFGALSWQLGLDHVLVRLSVGLICVFLIAIHLRWRHWGWQVRERQIWVRQGILGQSLDVFDLNLVQQARIVQNPHQRRKNLANLQLVLPQGAVTIPFIGFDQAADLANQAIYAAETAAVHRV